MVAAQAQQVQAGAQHGLPQQLPDASLLPGLGQAVGLDLLPQKPGCTGVDSSAQQPVGEVSSAGPLEADSSSRLRYFNWDQRDTARAAMQTLVSALSEDPINSYFTGSRKRQRKFVKDEVKGYLKALPRAANFIATADSKAVALWQLLPAETPRNELWAGWTRILAVSPRKWGQLLRLELHYEEAHEAIAAAHGPYYYLSFIGTAPEARGRGLGGRLLAEITSRADREGRWCLLEATSEKSQALYARHGFVTYEAFRVCRKAPPVFLMKRAPAAAVAPAPAAAAAPAAASTVAAPAAPVSVAIPEKLSTAAAGGALSPVFSIKAVAVVPERTGGSFSSSSSDSDSDSDELAAAVVAKEGAALRVCELSPPASPLIPAGREGGAAVEGHHLLLPAAAVGAGGSSGSVWSKAAAPGSPAADAQVIIRSASSTSLAKEPPSSDFKTPAAATAATAAAAAATIPGFAAAGSSKQGDSRVEWGVQQDEAGSDSSSRAGAGGPCGASAAGCC